MNLSTLVNQLASALGLIGIGSLLTVIIQHFLGLRVKSADRLFTERKEAFVGYLTAYTALGQGLTLERRGDFAYWGVRVQLVASRNVLKAMSLLENTPADSDVRQMAHDNLISMMRKDLRVVK